MAIWSIGIQAGRLAERQAAEHYSGGLILSYDWIFARHRRERITIDRTTWKVERQPALPGKRAARWRQYGLLAPLVTRTESGAPSSRAGKKCGVGVVCACTRECVAHARVFKSCLAHAQSVCTVR